MHPLQIAIDAAVTDCPKEGMTAREVAKKLGENPANVRRHMDQMVREGLLVRVSYFPKRYAPPVYEINMDKAREMFEAFLEINPNILVEAKAMFADTPDKRASFDQMLREMGFDPDNLTQE